MSDFSSVLPQDGNDHQVLSFDHSNNLNQTVLNGTPVTFSHNEMNETTSISGIRSSLVYDDLGRLSSYVQGSDTFELFWNAKDQLLSISKNGQNISSYEYYPASPMRSLKRVNGGVTESFYGTANLIHEVYQLDSNGVESASPVKEFVQEGIDRPLAMFSNIDGNSTTGTLEGREAYFYHSNPRGDVYALSNEAGEVVERYDYSLYGHVEVLDGAHNPISGNLSPYCNPFRFGSVYYDEETQFYWMRHRYYDPTLRGFLSRDPKADDSLGNLYAAFENHPGKHSDPLGLGNWAMEYEPGLFVSFAIGVGSVVDAFAKDPIGVTKSVVTDVALQPFYVSQDLIYSMAEMNDEQIRRLGHPGYRSWLIGGLEKRIMDGSSGTEAFTYAVLEGAASYTVPALGFKMAGKALGSASKNCPYNKLAPSKSFGIKEKGRLHVGTRENPGKLGGPINPAEIPDNCVNCVEAVLYNKLIKKVGANREFATAHKIAKLYGTTGRYAGTRVPHLGKVQDRLNNIGLDFEKIWPKSLEEMKEAGHYTLSSQHHIIYGRVTKRGEQMFYDPQVGERIFPENFGKILGTYVPDIRKIKVIE